jgi:hypothetical protein
MIFSTSSSPVPPRSFFAFFSALQQCLRWTLERRMRVDKAYLFAVLAAVFSFPLPCQKSVCEGREQRVKSFADICAEGRLAPAFSCPFLSCPCLPNGTQGISSKCSTPPHAKKVTVASMCSGSSSRSLACNDGWRWTRQFLLKISPLIL